MPINQTTRPGVRMPSSTNPRILFDDLDEKIRTLSPYQTPLQTLGNKLGRGKKPVSHKVEVIQYDEFDHWDFSTQNVVGTGAEARFMIIQPAQNNRRGAQGNSMFYFPQDKIAMVATSQVVEVMMTEDAAYQLPGQGNNFSFTPVAGGALDTLLMGLTGNTTGATYTRMPTGYVLVRNIETRPLRTIGAANANVGFSGLNGSDIIYLGRSHREGQDIGGRSYQSDVWYDMNYVEEREAVFECTEAQKNFIKTKGGMPDWQRNQEEIWKNFKIATELNAFWSERSIEYTVASEPMRHMRGLIPTIQTHISVYNPYSTTSFEQMFYSFIEDQAFRHSPNGNKKVMMAGYKLMGAVAREFAPLRRMDLKDRATKVGLDIETFSFMGNEIKLIRNDVFRPGTPHEWWGVVIDPVEAEWRIAKDYTTREYSLPTERKYKIAIEWAGTIAWHREPTHALLRTV